MNASNAAHRRLSHPFKATILLGTVVTAAAAMPSAADSLSAFDREERDTDGRITFGLGLGALYGGLGVNVGLMGEARFAYGSIGCIGASSSSSSGDGALDEDENGTNCGIGLGILGTGALPGDRHGLGLNLGLTYDSTEFDDDKVQWHVRPTYNYFFGGIGAEGFNLGFSPVLTFDEDGTHPSLLLNLGYQF